MSIKELKSKTLYKEYSLEIPFSEVENLLNNETTYEGAPVADGR